MHTPCAPANLRWSSRQYRVGNAAAPKYRLPDTKIRRLPVQMLFQQSNGNGPTHMHCSHGGAPTRANCQTCFAMVPHCGRPMQRPVAASVLDVANQCPRMQRKQQRKRFSSAHLHRKPIVPQKCSQRWFQRDALVMTDECEKIEVQTRAQLRGREIGADEAMFRPKLSKGGQHTARDKAARVTVVHIFKGPKNSTRLCRQTWARRSCSARR